MESLLDTMFIKRFYLPSTTDIDVLESQKRIETKMCECGNYHHIACVFKANGEKHGIPHKMNIISFGTNKYKDVEGLEPTIHAERDVLSKLPTIKNKKTVHINILVVRFTKYRKTGPSKPCHDCVQAMHQIPECKGYKIQRIYYSDYDGKIIKTNLKNLQNSQPHYTRFHKDRKHVFLNE
jgi:cytidine deaminase